jgi:hypothetical protein
MKVIRKIGSELGRRGRRCNDDNNDDNNNNNNNNPKHLYDDVKERDTER